MTDWTLCIAALPPGLLGYTDHRSHTIYLQAGLSQAQRRATLAHELNHARRPPVPRPVVALDEAEVDQLTARELIPLASLISALRWVGPCGALAELAEELWVDQATVRTRLQHLHPSERHAIARALDDEAGGFNATG
ncbi:hypothetical protein IEE94_11045 [Yimella sp. cx-573]|nr:hypothetical protein [Yimella sp. cx-573]